MTEPIKLPPWPEETYIDEAAAFMSHCRVVSVESAEAYATAAIEADRQANKITGETSDGYHTFNELYAHRVRLFCLLMHAHKNNAWWSRKHHDGSAWEGWVIAGIDTPEGTATYHLPESEIENLPEGIELPIGKEWDGHTSDDVLVRLLSLRQARGDPVAWLCTPDFEGEQFLATTQGAADTLEKDGWSVRPLYEAPQHQQQTSKHVKDRRIDDVVRGLKASVAVGSDGQWVSVRREARDAAINRLQELNSDCAHMYESYVEAAAGPAPQPQQQVSEPVKYQRLTGWSKNGVESLCVSLDIQQQSGGGSKACAVAASLLRGIAEQHFAIPQPQQIPEGYKPTKLNIGVSATTEGAAICIMKPNADGTVTVIYSGTHPLGDSLGSAMLEAAPEPEAKP